MNTLSVFIDESGDFGEGRNAAPYYLVSMIFHDQSECINEAVEKFENALRNCVFHDQCVHTGPIIRREVPYDHLSIDERRKILFTLRSFMLACNIKQHTFIAERRITINKMDLSAALSKAFSSFIRDHLEYLLSYDEIIVYYDNGQSELGSILTAIFNAHLNNIEFRQARPQQYKLLQVADFICTMELLKIKLEKNSLTSSEQKFFYKPQELKKSFIKPVIKLRY